MWDREMAKRVYYLVIYLFVIYVILASLLGGVFLPSRTLDPLCNLCMNGCSIINRLQSHTSVYELESDWQNYHPHRPYLQQAAREKGHWSQMFPKIRHKAQCQPDFQEIHMEQIHDQVYHQLLDATGFRWQGKSRAPFKEDTL